MSRNPVNKAWAVLLISVLFAQSLAPLTYAQQGGGGSGGGPSQPSDPNVTPGTDPWDTLLPDVYTDLPLGHPDELNASYNANRSYMWDAETLACLNDIDYSADSKDPLTWVPSGDNGNGFHRNYHVMPWETGRGSLESGRLIINDGGGGTGGNGIGIGSGGGDRGQISGKLNTNTGKLDFSVPIVSFSGKGVANVSLDMVLRPPSLPNFISTSNMWTDSYDIRLDVTEPGGWTGQTGTAVMRTSQGTLFPFKKVAGVWLSPYGFRAKLVNVNGLGYQLQWTNGDVWFFGGLNTGGTGRYVTQMNFRKGGSIGINRTGNSTTISTSGRTVTIARGVFPENSNAEYKITDPMGRIFYLEKKYFLQWGWLPALIRYPNSIKSVEFIFGGSTLATGPNGSSGSMVPLIQGYKDGRGLQTTYSYFLDGRVSRITNPAGKFTSYGYGTSGVTQILDERGKTSFDYYVNGSYVGSKDPNGFTTVISRNTEHEITGFRNQRGQTWTIARNANGQATSVTNPLNKSTTYTYNQYGDMLTKKNAYQHTTTFHYDPTYGQLTSVVDPLNRTAVSITYDSDRNPYTVKDALNRTTTFGYNSYGDTTSVTSPEGLNSTILVNGLGLPTQTTDSLNRTTVVTYDHAMRVKKVTGPTGIINEVFYDGEDNVVKVKDGVGRETLISFNNIGLIGSQTNPRGDIETYTYDESGNLKTVTNGRGYTRTNYYTDRGDLYYALLPDGGYENYQFNGDGSMSSFNGSGRSKISYGYDAAGRMTLMDYVNMTDTVITFDDAGRRISMLDGTGLTSWFYNAASELETLNQAGKVTTYEYNLAGERKKMVQPQGTTIYTYDTHGRVTGIQNPFGENTTFGYDAYCRVIRKTLQDGHKETYAYDGLDRLQTMQVVGTNNLPTRIEGYTYNNSSEVLTHTIDGVATTYGYDGASQLLNESRPGYNVSYTYDGNGNRLTKTLNGVTENYAYDSGDKMLSAGAKTYGYDLAGRTTSVTSPTGTTTLTYDDESRLKTVNGPGLVHSYSYNGMDTRTSKTANAVITNYHRDGAYVTDPVIWDTGATYTPGISERRNSATTYLHGGLKDKTLQTNSSGGTVASRVYDAFGMVTNSVGTWQGPFGYAGGAGYQEDETGLQLLGHRYYDPSTGRFLTRDPIEDGRNWYSYCNNNPVNCVDANGLEPGKPYDSADEAAKAALADCLQKSNDEGVEYGGLIYYKDGKYYYTAARTDSNPNKVHTAGKKNEVRRDVEKLGGKVVADYHTHPDPYDDNMRSGYFSPNDRIGADNLGEDAYMASGGSGIVKKYKPRKGSNGQGDISTLGYIPVTHKKSPNRKPVIRRSGDRQ